MIVSTTSIIVNTKFIDFNANGYHNHRHLDVCISIIIFNTKFIDFNTKFNDFNANRYRNRYQSHRPLRYTARQPRTVPSARAVHQAARACLKATIFSMKVIIFSVEFINFSMKSISFGMKTHLPCRRDPALQRPSLKPPRPFRLQNLGVQQ